MSRRLVPGLFWIGVVGCATLVVVPLGRAVPPGPPPVVLSGTSIGFWRVQDPFGGGSTALALYDLGRRANRRYQGPLIVGLEGAPLFNAINVTLTGADFYVGTGGGDLGKFVLRGYPTFFDGGAMISSTELALRTGGGHHSQADLFALRAFDDPAGPLPAGTWSGTFLSQSGTQGGLRLDVAPPESLIHPSLSFQGDLILAPDALTGMYFAQLGTISDTDGRFIMIGQGSIGRISAEGFFSSSTERGPFADAIYQLYTEGGVDFGTINFSLNTLE